MLHLLFIANSSSLGGSSLSLLDLLQRLPRDRYTATVVVPEAGPLVAAAAPHAADVQVLAHPRWVTSGGDDSWLYAIRTLPAAVERLRALMRTWRPDAVCSVASTTPAGALAAALERLPHVWWVQEFLGQGFCGGPLVPATLHGTILALSDAVIAISSALRDAFPDPGRVEYISAGVATARFHTVTPDYDGGLVLSLGANSESKGLGDLVEASIVLAARGVPCKVVAVGDFYYPDYLARMRARVAQAGIADRVRFEPFATDIAPWLTRAAVYCCPSHTEGMSRTIIEAMAAALPVVATDCGGPRDLVCGGTTGHLVPVRDPVRMADALANLLRDPDTRRRFGAAGRAASAVFDADILAPRVLERIEAAIRRAAVPTERAALADLLVTALAVAGPRTLLGRKWRLLRRFLG